MAATLFSPAAPDALVAPPRVAGVAGQRRLPDRRRGLARAGAGSLTGYSPIHRLFTGVPSPVFDIETRSELLHSRPLLRMRWPMHRPSRWSAGRRRALHHWARALIKRHPLVTGYLP